MASLYRPNEMKLDSKTVGRYFIGYSERLRGYEFNYPTIRLIFKIGNARFLKIVEFLGRDKVRDSVFKEEYVTIHFVAIDNDHN